MNHHYRIINTLIISISLLTSISWSQSGWMALNSGTAYNLKAVYLLNYDNLFVTGEGARVLKSSDAGNSWQDISPAFSSVNFDDVVFFDSLTGLVVGSTGTILRTTDGGTNWSPVTSGVADNLYSVTFFDSAGICGGQSQTILTSSDLGQSWSVAQSGFFGGGFWGTCMLSPQIGYVIGENSIFQPLLGKTSNSGQNWNFVAFYLNNNEGRAHDVLFTDLNIGYAACRVWDGRGAIAKTSDGGGNWSSTFFTHPLHGINFPISATGLIGYAVGEGGTILKTMDAGNGWQSQTSGVNYSLYDIAFLDFDYGLAVGEGGTILKTQTGGVPPAYQQPTDKVGLSEFRLIGNYPNPFNPITKIEFRIPNTEFVTLKIYNLLGQEVTSLHSASLLSGSHSFIWDASNLAGGIYLCRLQAGQFIQTRKMVLMK